MSACLQASTQRKLLIISLHGLFVSKSHFETEKNVLENRKVFLLEFFVGFENLKMARLVPPTPSSFSSSFLSTQINASRSSGNATNFGYNDRLFNGQVFWLVLEDLSFWSRYVSEKFRFLESWRSLAEPSHKFSQISANEWL